MRLTEYATGGGCGCKLSPTLLRQLLQQANVIGGTMPENLLVGAATADDAAVWRMNETQAIIATTDFFSPVVDDAYDFGRIAATNAISDIYAMGGTPFLALALAAMPQELAPATIAAIFSGGQAQCQNAGVVIAGGHSIAAKEPLYGLAVIGQAHPDHVMTNAKARCNDVLLLGKPLGIGVLSAALKQQKLSATEYETMVSTTTQLNSAGMQLALLAGARAMTDVTGFGLLGHLAEICRASGVGACLNFSDIPKIAAAVTYAQNGVITGAAKRNRESVSEIMAADTPLADWQYNILTDPQTSGGLLFVCSPETVAAAQAIFLQHGQQAAIIGAFNSSGKIEVQAVC